MNFETTGQSGGYFCLHAVLYFGEMAQQIIYALWSISEILLKNNVHSLTHSINHPLIM